MASTQIKLFTSLFFSTLFLQIGVAQKLNEIYFIENKRVQSDSIISLPSSESSVVLPIILKTFQATSLNTENIITWTTSYEQNVKEFVLERSINSTIDWKTIATVSAENASSHGTTRTIYDLNPECVTYYRLRSIDLDGKEIVSKIISLERKCKKTTNINTFPNPTQASLNINFDASQAGVVIMSFTDMLGRVILQKKSDAIEGINNVSVDLSGLRKGLYIITFTDSNNNITSQRIEKN